MTGHHFGDTRKQRFPACLIIHRLSSQRAQRNLQKCIIHPLIGTLIDSINEVLPADKTNLYSVLPPIEEDTRDKVFGRRGPFSHEYLLTPEDCTPYRKAEKEEIYLQTTSNKLKKRMCKWEKMKKGSCAFGSSCRYYHD